MTPDPVEDWPAVAPPPRPVRDTASADPATELESPNRTVAADDEKPGAIPARPAEGKGAVQPDPGPR